MISRLLNILFLCLLLWGLLEFKTLELDIQAVKNKADHNYHLIQELFSYHIPTI